MRIMRILTTIALPLLAYTFTYAYDNDVNSNTICGISNIPLKEINTVTKGTDPVTLKKMLRADTSPGPGVTVSKITTCDFGNNDGIAIAVEYSEGTKLAFLFE